MAPEAGLEPTPLRLTGGGLDMEPYCFHGPAGVERRIWSEQNRYGLWGDYREPVIPRTSRDG